MFSLFLISICILYIHLLHPLVHSSSTFKAQIRAPLLWAAYPDVTLYCILSQSSHSSFCPVIYHSVQSGLSLALWKRDYILVISTYSLSTYYVLKYGWWMKITEAVWSSDREPSKTVHLVIMTFELNLPEQRITPSCFQSITCPY